MVQTNSYCRGFRKNKLNETDQTVFKLQNKFFSEGALTQCFVKI